MKTKPVPLFEDYPDVVEVADLRQMLGGISSQQYLWKRYPFVAHELSRQDLFDKIKEMIKPLN